MAGKLKKRAARFIRRSAGVDSLKGELEKQGEALRRFESALDAVPHANVSSGVAMTLGMMAGEGDDPAEVADRLFRGLPSASGVLGQAQRLQVILLAYLDKVCAADSIGYWLDSSMLAGAIARRGFAPWERDAAVGMTRSDFGRLKSALAEKHDGFYLHELYSHSASGSVNHTCQLKFQGADEAGCPVCLNIYLYDYRDGSAWERAEANRDRIKEQHLSEAAGLATALLKEERLPEFEGEFQARMKGLFDRYLGRYVEECSISLVEPREGLIYALDNHPVGAGAYDAYHRRDDVFPLARVPFEGVLLQVPCSVASRTGGWHADAASLAEGLEAMRRAEEDLAVHGDAISAMLDRYEGLLDVLVQVESHRSAGLDAEVAEPPVARMGVAFDSGECVRLTNPYPMSEADHAECTAHLQVMKRVVKLGIDVDSPLDFKGSCERIASAVPAAELSKGASPREFSGRTASMLNELLSDVGGGAVSVCVDELLLDEAIVVPSGVSLLGDGTRIVRGPQAVEAAIVLDGVSGAMVRGFTIDGVADFGISVRDSQSFALVDNVICGMARKGVSVIGRCSRFRISGNELVGNVDGCLFIDGEIELGVVERNEIARSTTAQNFSAGILVGARDVADLEKPYDETKEPPLDARLEAPHDLLIADNVIHDHFAQGIYVFGGYRLFITRNQVFGNQREGMCLDYGAIACAVVENRFTANGGRAPEHLNEKVPGVSFDNAAYNVVWGNVIERNSGSGVKLVRSSCCNTIAHNEIAYNNLGSNAVHHFFGVTIGGTLVPDFEGQVDLDLAPSYDNVVAHNLIVGCHFAGIHVDGGCYKNTCYGNEVVDPELWAVECVSERDNRFFDNVSSAPDRIIEL